MVLLIFCVVWQMFCTALECLKSFHARRKVWLQESHPQQNRKSLKTIHKKRRKKKKPVLEMKPFILSPCVLNLPDKWERSAEKDSSMNNKKKIKVTLFAHSCFNFS